MEGHSQIIINAPVEETFSYMADFSRHPEWTHHRLRMEMTSPGPVGVGTTFTSIGRHVGKDRTNYETITELVPNEAIAFDGVDRIGVFHHRFRFEDEDGRTRLVRSVEAEIRPRIPRLLLPVLLRTLVPYLLHRDLKGVKRSMEARRAAPGTPGLNPA